MPKTTGVLLFLSGMAALGGAAAADDTALHQCVSIDDDAARLACYDEAAGRSDAGAADSAAAATITADYGAEQLDGDNPDKKIERPVSVRITACQRDQRRRYYFYLENGQVWRQNDDDRLRFKECDFNATIIRDGFGYKMQIEGEKRRTRVKRVK